MAAGKNTANARKEKWGEEAHKGNGWEITVLNGGRGRIMMDSRKFVK